MLGTRAPDKFDLNDIRFILSVARNGSMTSAADVMRHDVSTVSRRISSAEKTLGVRLFTRVGSRCQLTPAGRVLVARAERIVDEIEVMLAACLEESGELSGLIRITSTQLLIDFLAGEHLGQFRSRYPKIQLQLIAADENLSFTRHEADVALRLARPTGDAAVAARKIASIGFAVFGSEAARNLPRSEWPQQAWICYEDTLAETPEMRWLDSFGVRNRSFRTNSIATMSKICAGGNGLALLPCFTATETENLLQLSEGVELYREVWILRHRDLGSSSRHKAVASWISEVFRSSRGPLSGVAPPR